MTENELMGVAIAEALKSKEPMRCGCVIAKDVDIVSVAFNSQREDNDATAHDGIKAIALAGKKLGNKDLQGCTVFCTHEPCTMCLSALIFAKVDALFYGIALKDATYMHKRIQVDAEELLTKSPRPMRLFKGFMKAAV